MIVKELTIMDEKLINDGVKASRQENLRLVFRLCKSNDRQTSHKTKYSENQLRFPCLGLSSIMDFISPKIFHTALSCLIDM